MTSVHDEAVHQTTPWGLWATLGFALLVAIAFVAVQLTCAVAFMFWHTSARGAVNTHAAISQLATNGLLMSVSTLVTAPLCLGLIALAVRLRRGATLRGYLALHRVAWPEYLRWIGLTAVLLGLADMLIWLFGRPLVPEFMRATYMTATSPPLYWLAVIAAAPLFEETFFRGFLYAGIRQSRIGAGGAVVLTAAAWSAIHVQYDLIEIAIVFAGGLLLGYARHRSGSTTVPIALHAFWNAVALIEVAIVAGTAGARA